MRWLHLFPCLSSNYPDDDMVVRRIRCRISVDVLSIITSLIIAIAVVVTISALDCFEYSDRNHILMPRQLMRV